MRNSIFLLAIGMTLSMLSFCAQAQTNSSFVHDVGLDEPRLQLEITESPVFFVVSEVHSDAYLINDLIAPDMQLMTIEDQSKDPFLYSANNLSETNCCRELPYVLKPELRNEIYNYSSIASNDCCRDIIIPLATDLNLVVFDSKSQPLIGDLTPILFYKNNLVRRAKPSNPPNLYGRINLTNPKYRYRHAGV